MAESKPNRSESQKTTGQGLAQHERSRRGVQRWEPRSFASPFELMDRMTEEMDQVFDRMFRGFGLPRRSWTRGTLEPSGREGIWTPRIEAFQKGDRFIVRADLPGLKRDDIHVELRDDALTIQGERREEHEEEREGYFHSEREYGHFARTIPLPEGVISESAQANFRDGVLEISMQAAPSEAQRGRRLEIKEASESERKS
jgi:HSP20 family protein